MIILAPKTMIQAEKDALKDLTINIILDEIDLNSLHILTLLSDCNYDFILPLDQKTCEFFSSKSNYAVIVYPMYLYNLGKTVKKFLSEEYRKVLDKHPLLYSNLSAVIQKTLDEYCGISCKEMLAHYFDNKGGNFIFLTFNVSEKLTDIVKHLRSLSEVNNHTSKYIDVSALYNAAEGTVVKSTEDGFYYILTGEKICSL